MSGTLDISTIFGDTAIRHGGRPHAHSGPCQPGWCPELDGALAERKRILALLRNTDPIWMNKLREEANDLLLPDKNEQIYRSSLGLINIQVRAVLSAIAAKIGGKR